MKQKNAELTAGLQIEVKELRTYEEREQDLSQLLQSMIDKQLLELKALTEKTATMQIPPVKATSGESSTPSISHEEVFAKDRTNTMLVPLRSIQFPALIIDVQIQVRQPVEVNWHNSLLINYR